eukprot:scaffold597_cov173-Chaetoceros_neogracile.AAC.2
MFGHSNGGGFGNGGVPNQQQQQQGGFGQHGNPNQPSPFNQQQQRQQQQQQQSLPAASPFGTSSNIQMDNTAITSNYNNNTFGASLTMNSNTQATMN